MNKLYYLLGFLLVISCELITEPDIEDSEVILIAPANNLKTETTTHTFWWEHVPDAERYNLLIVSPTWDSVVQLVVDTNLSSNKFVATLPPGEYDWAVSAYNSSSSTGYYINHLTIDTATSLNYQTVVLRSPENDYHSPKRKIIFEWYKLEIADSYLFDIKKDSWQGESVIPTKLTTYDTLKISLNEGIYYWGIQAKNDFSNTIYSTRKLTVDTTAPEIPNITIPQKHGDTLSSQNLKITWKHPKESLSPISDSVLISSDSSNFYSNIIEQFVTKELDAGVSGYAAGHYYVKIRSFDAAGNLGESTAIKKFSVNEE